ncbi:signal recognition particle 19 kDa subunit [Cavenderia fasciculata]|uniref:Signal recognition particle 19 kDa subunit n=1 Tax=Cavenderia fasciculata TaxID=261658 RepID=F4PL67_CACFS|nr:signal recognition particle 19 kDa subunit [Cavenderia fasciculata]EGG23289.1 signal recognition particle 19 kDa subunit [Cavenderia fasciculata]|eukprot:XP_004361140.1 signal recognition particle 19 kDa subunit [Cavenderia fasciculata]
MSTAQPQVTQVQQPKMVNTSTIPNYKKFTVVYPQYMNSSLKRDQGRKVPKDKGVKNPMLEEIAKAIAMLGLHPIIETSKGYPADFYQRGRIRLQIINFETQVPLVASISNKTQLLLKICEYINTNYPNRPEDFKPESMLMLNTPIVKPKEEKEIKKVVDNKKKKGK